MHACRSTLEDPTAEHREAFITTFAPYDRVVLLAGSCGLELFVNLRLPQDFLAKSHIFAYGPVARSLPACATLLLVQGDRDPISRWWQPRPHERIRCSHMAYLESPELGVLFRNFFHSLAPHPHAAA